MKRLALVIVVLALVVGCGITSMSPAKSAVGKIARFWNPAEEQESVHEITISPIDGTEDTTLIGPETIIAPPGADVVVRIKDRQGKGDSAEEHIERATASGPSIRGADLNKIQLDAPDVSLSGGLEASAGGGFIDMVAKASTGLRVLYVIGGLLVVAGVFCGFVLNKIWMGVGVVGSGIGLIATAYLFEMYPWVVLLAAVIVVALLIWFVLSSCSSQTRDKALHAVIRGVQLTPGNGGVKKRIALESRKDFDRIDLLIQRIKKAEHLKNFSLGAKPKPDGVDLRNS